MMLWKFGASELTIALKMSFRVYKLMSIISDKFHVLGLLPIGTGGGVPLLPVPVLFTGGGGGGFLKAL